MYSNRCLIFCKLFNDYNSQVSCYYRDLAYSIGQMMFSDVKCKLYCSYPEIDVRKQLQSLQFGEVRVLDPILQNSDDFAFLLNSENSQAALHLFFTKQAYCNSFANSSNSLKQYLQKTNKLILDEQCDQASPFSLAKKIGAKVVICLDMNTLNQQAINLLDEILSNKMYDDLIIALAIYNGQSEQFNFWQNLLKQRYNKQCCWHNQKCINEEYFKAALKSQTQTKSEIKADILQLSSKIYKRLASYGLEKQKLRIGLAFDEAFSAYDTYELQFLSQLGIEWYKFSPLRSDILPVNCLAYYFAANDLQRFLAKLSTNTYMRKQLKDAYKLGRLFIAQDQAHLYLIEGVVDIRGQYYPQVGLISQKARIIDTNINYAYAQVRAYNANFFAPQSMFNLALVNQSVELYPKIGSLYCNITASCDQQQKQVNSGYCDNQIFSSLNRFWPTTNYAWLENFYLSLIKQYLKMLQA